MSEEKRARETGDACGRGPRAGGVGSRSRIIAAVAARRPRYRRRLPPILT